MSDTYLFLISYRLDSQARTTEVESEAEILTPEQARFHLESLHTSVLPAEITDVQVRPLAQSSQGAPAGHKLYP
ncbi:MAG: hypothetical protein AAAB13_01915 [Pseudomonas sp.]